MAELGLTALCDKHGILLVLCDECGNTLIYARWAESLSGAELATRLDKIAESSRYFGPNEKRALLTEAARRLRGDRSKGNAR